MINIKKINIVIIENKIKNIFSNQKGMALLTTLMFVFILATFAVALLIMTGNDTKLSAIQRDSTQAFYVAEAGVEYARYLLGQSWDNWKDPEKFPITSFGSGTFDVEVTENDDGNIVITSTGIVGTAKRVIEVVVSRATVDPIFKYAIAGKGEVKLEDEATAVLGDVYCEGDIVNEGVTVEGWGIATGTVTGAMHFEYGTQVGPEYAIDFPTLDLVYYKSEAQENGLVVPELDITNEVYIIDDCIIYVEGNVSFSNSTIIGPGIIVAEGTISLVNNSTSEETVVGFFSNHKYTIAENIPSIKIEIGAELNLDIYGVIFAPQGNVKMDTELGLYGSVVGGATGAEDISVKLERGSGVFHYDALSYIIDLLPSDPVPAIVYWREKV